MPAVSQAQFRLMAKAMNDAAFARRMGINRSDAADFVHKTKHPSQLPERVKAAHKALKRKH